MSGERRQEKKSTYYAVHQMQTGTTILKDVRFVSQPKFTFIKKEVKTLTAQTTLTDAERVAIEAEIKEMYEKSMVAMENVDLEYFASITSDEYALGYIDNGFFFQSSDDMIEAFREGFDRLERQELLERIKFRIAVLASNVVVITALIKTTVFHKDGTTFTGNFALTFICNKIGDDWKFIHSHQSIQPQE